MDPIQNNTKLPIIIIGTGLAGYNLAKELRKNDSEVPLILITQDDGHFYSKPQLSTAFYYKKTPESLIITDVSQMQNQLSVKIIAFSTVQSIDNLNQKIYIQTPEGETSLDYGKLVLATGAYPKPLPLLSHIQNQHRINNLVDYHFFAKKLNHYQALTILGSGLVGCEFAHDLLNQNKKISIVTLQDYPLQNLVPQEIGNALQTALRERGIEWHTKTSVLKIQEQDSSVSLSLNNGIRLETDAILCAIGLTPNTTLAKTAGIQINQGIMVNEFLETSQPNIYALGDCAEVNGKCQQYVAPILQCARTLSQTLLGKPTPIYFPLMPISLKMNSFPVIVLPPNVSEDNFTWHIEKEGLNVKAQCLDNDENLVGFALCGQYIELRQEYLKRASLTVPVNA